MDKPTANTEPHAPLAAVEARVTVAAKDVLNERQRQINVEGWTAEHDDEHDDGELEAAGAAYALAAADERYPASCGDGGFAEAPPDIWPWDASWWKPGTPRRMLVKAAALLIAAIEQIDRKSNDHT